MRRHTIAARARALTRGAAVTRGIGGPSTSRTGSTARIAGDASGGIAGRASVLSTKYDSVAFLVEERKGAGHVRGSDRRRRVQVRRVERREAVDAEERHADADLVLQ